jgi:hypothetical protein
MLMATGAWSTSAALLLLLKAGRLVEHNAQTATAARLIAMLASMSTPIACRMI